jgi:uncharacterized protein (TIRG00374 family)
MDLMTESSTPTKKKQSRWYLVFTLALAALFLYLALRDISWQEVLDTFRQTRLEFVALAFLISTLALFARGFRWGVLVSAEKPISLMTAFFADAAGYLGNTVLPARAGEVLRSALLGRRTGISVSYVFATAIAERVIDVLVLVLIGLVTLPVLGTLPDWLPSAMRAMAVLGLVAVAVLVLAPRFESFFQAILQRLPMPERWREPLKGFVNQFLRGAQAFMDLKRAGAFLALTAVIWLLDGVGTIMMGRALGLSYNLAQAELFLVALGLSSAIPSTPGYVGVYQFVAVSILPAFGFTRSQSLTYILAAQANNILMILIWGLVGLWRLGFKKSEL